MGTSIREETPRKGSGPDFLAGESRILTDIGRTSNEITSIKARSCMLPGSEFGIPPRTRKATVHEHPCAYPGF